MSVEVAGCELELRVPFRGVRLVEPQTRDYPGCDELDEFDLDISRKALLAAARSELDDDVELDPDDLYAVVEEAARQAVEDRDPAEFEVGD